MDLFEVDDTLLPTTRLNIGKPLKAPNEILEFEDVRIPYDRPLVMSPKIDGNRGLAIRGELYTSSMKPVRNESFKQVFSCLADFSRKHEVVFDYEVFDPHAKHHAEISGVLNSYDQQISSTLCVYVFDAAYQMHYENQCYDAPYQDRIELYHRLVGVLSNSRIIAVPQYPVRDPSQAKEMFEQFLEQGWEGGMLRTTTIWEQNGRVRGGYYKHGRCSHNMAIMWKFKEYVTLDGKIISVIPRREMNPNAPRDYDELGYLKPVKSIEFTHEIEEVGAFEVKYRDPVTREVKKCNVGWGKGFDRDERKRLWKIRDSLIGKWLEFKHMPHGSKGDGAARHGRLIRFRPDKDS